MDTGQPPIMLQGKAYMTFIAFVVPEILKEIEGKKDKTKVLEESIVSPKIPMVDNAEGGEGSNLLKNVSVPGSGESYFQTMMLGFQKMESEVIKLHDNRVGIVDASINSIKDNIDMKKFEQNIDKLERIAFDNKLEFNVLNNKIDQVITSAESKTY